jgi:hypothetical protein
LKPDVSTLRRRSDCFDWRLRICSEEQGARRRSYLVRMIKPKPDPFSRLACSTNLSKILTACPPERGRWIEAQAVKPGCPRTRLRYLSDVLPYVGPFLREPSKGIELHVRCQGLNSSIPKATRAAQNIKDQPAKCPSH